MSDRAILQRYSRPRDENPLGALAGVEADGPDDLGAFGWLRGVRERALMLELRKKDGNIMAVGYGWLERAEYDPSVGITLGFIGQKIVIKGRNLNAETRPLVRLFEGIIRHRVPWVVEADGASGIQAGNGETVVEAIAW